MKINELKCLISGGESETLEFKRTTAQLKAAFETVCAFLNGKGGIVLFGVTNSGQITGQEVSDKTKREIARELTKIEPTPRIELSYISLEKKKKVIVLTVLKGNHSPYIYNGRSFLRNQSTTEKMSQHCYEQLLVKRGQLTYSWEEGFASDYALSDLDHEEIYRTVVEAISKKRVPASIAKEKPEKILRQLNLIVDEKIRNAAIVLFAKGFKSAHLQCWLKMARFRGTDKTNKFIDNRQIYCNAFRMIEEVDHFLSRHLPIASYFHPDEWQRIDKPVLPSLAVREALVNAICHRCYEDQAGYISIAIFDDRLEIWNNGSLPKEIKIADLKREHDSILRNKLIAHVFYLRGYIEAWGTGTITMNNLCKENDIPSVRFVKRTKGLAVIFKFAQPLGGQVADNRRKLTERQHEILKVLKIAPLNGTQLVGKLTSAPSVRMLQKDLVRLEEAGLIERKGKARSIIWSIKKS